MGFVRVKNVYILRVFFAESEFVRVKGPQNLRVFFAESEFVRVKHPQNLRVFSTKSRFVRVNNNNYSREYGIIGKHTTAGDPYGRERSDKEAVFKGV